MAVEAICARGEQADWLALDVTDACAVSVAIVARLPFHILVNNAGMNKPRMLTDTPDEDIARYSTSTSRQPSTWREKWRAACRRLGGSLNYR